MVNFLSVIGSDADWEWIGGFHDYQTCVLVAVFLSLFSRGAYALLVRTPDPDRDPGRDRVVPPRVVTLPMARTARRSGECGHLLDRRHDEPVTTT